MNDTSTLVVATCLTRVTWRRFPSTFTLTLTLSLSNASHDGWCSFRRLFPLLCYAIISAHLPGHFAYPQQGIATRRSSPRHFAYPRQVQQSAYRGQGRQAVATMSSIGDTVELKNAGYEGASVRIPVLGLGVYQAPPNDAIKAVTLALQNGYRHIDSAHIYRNEQAVGKAVRDSGIPREEVFVTTKLWNSDHGYENTLSAFARSLKELGLDYVDLYLVHSPIPIDKRLDTWKAMEKILKSGKAKSIGVSNYGVHHLKELFNHCEIRPSINQVELHPFNPRSELVKFCEAENIVLEAYSPLTQGRRLNDVTLQQVAAQYQKTPAQLLIRWCIQKNFVVLPKSVTPSRILENAQVFDFNISPEHMATLDRLDDGWVAAWDPTKGE